jgi:hypothetical protein
MPNMLSKVKADAAKRYFATKGAKPRPRPKPQRPAQMGPTGPQNGRSAPVAKRGRVPRTQMAVSTDRLGATVTGSEPLGPLLVGAAGLDVQGYTPFSFGLSPANFATRLQLFGQLYERFEFLEAHVDWVPSVPTSTPGSYTLFFETDPAAASVGQSGTIDYQIASAHETSVSVAAWNPGRCTYRRPRQTPSFYCFPSDNDLGRFTTQGVFQAVVEAPTALAANSVIGQFHLRYKVRFTVPQFEPVVSSLSSIAAVTGTIGAGTNQVTLVPEGDFILSPAQTSAAVSNLSMTCTLPTSGTYYVDIVGGMACTTASNSGTFAIGAVSPANLTAVVNTPNVSYGTWTCNGTGVQFGGSWKVTVPAGATAGVFLVTFPTLNMTGVVGKQVFKIVAYPAGVIPNAAHDALGFRRKTRMTTPLSKVKQLEDRLAGLESLLRKLETKQEEDEEGEDEHFIALGRDLVAVSNREPSRSPRRG